MNNKTKGILLILLGFLIIFIFSSIMIGFLLTIAMWGLTLALTCLFTKGISLMK